MPHGYQIPNSILRVILLVVTTVGLMSYSFYAGGSIAKRYAPLINAIMHIKSDVSIAHLWLEEFVSGDSYITLTDVKGYLDSAHDIGEIVLEGGRYQGQVFPPLKDEHLVTAVKRIQASVERFSNIAEQRWQTVSLSGIGTRIDQQLDGEFSELLAATTSVEVSLKQDMQSQLRMFEYIQILLVLLVIVFGMRFAYVLYRHESRRADDQKSLQIQESSLRDSERRYQTLFEKTNDAIFVIERATGYFSDANASALELTGLSLTDLKKLYYRELIPEVPRAKLQGVVDLVEETDLGVTEYIRPDLEKRVVRLSAISLDDYCVIGVARDITDEHLAEQHLQRSHKMDAIGQISGGIAHDFNNLLGVIIGNLDLLEMEQGINDKARKRFDTVRDCSVRAASLTKQLLGFSRVHHAKVVDTDVNGIIGGMANLIDKSVTPQVEVAYQLEQGLGATTIDPEDFRDALLNLVLNARDAMEGSGKLVIRTGSVFLDSPYCRQHPDAKPGEYIEVAVSDLGKGMSREVQEKIFEPFFTTKPAGKGTGLGLSMVYGFIKRSCAHIRVISAPGRGTTFYLYLRASESDGTSQPLPQTADRTGLMLPAGTEKILVVDDEEGLRLVAGRFLENLGYRVITAVDASDALEKMAETPDVDLVFSDVVMPGDLNGYELANAVTEKYPAVSVLLTSGYAKQSAGEVAGGPVLAKPYTQSELALSVRKTLDVQSRNLANQAS